MSSIQVPIRYLRKEDAILMAAPLNRDISCVAIPVVGCDSSIVISTEWPSGAVQGGRTPKLAADHTRSA